MASTFLESMYIKNYNNPIKNINVKMGAKFEIRIMRGSLLCRQNN